MIDRSSIAYVKGDVYKRKGLENVEELLEILTSGAELEIMDGNSYPEDVCKKISGEDIRTAKGIYFKLSHSFDPVEELVSLDEFL